MSEDTERALREAIIAHSADINEGEHDGDLLCDWIVCTHWVLAKDDTSDGYARYRPTGQPYHRSMGLLQNALNDFIYANLRADDDAS